MAQAKSAAGDRRVHVIGAYTARRAIEAGVLYKVQLHLIRVIFGGGRRLLRNSPDLWSGVPRSSSRPPRC